MILATQWLEIWSSIRFRFTASNRSKSHTEQAFIQISVSSWEFVKLFNITMELLSNFTKQSIAKSGFCLLSMALPSTLVIWL
jgi:hypothetical protein